MGKVFAWGVGSNGQLGINVENQFTPTPVSLPGQVKQISPGGYHSLFLLTTGNVYASGSATGGCLGIGIASETENVTSPTEMDCKSLLVLHLIPTKSPAVSFANRGKE
jgi:alpha-tubulin suppressor-like RCC1 family protein